MFTSKIPNLDALRDFFTHECKRLLLYFLLIIYSFRYCPTARDMTTTFAKKILSGKKELLLFS